MVFIILSVGITFFIYKAKHDALEIEVYSNKYIDTSKKSELTPDKTVIIHNSNKIKKIKNILNEDYEVIEPINMKTGAYPYLIIREKGDEYKTWYLYETQMSYNVTDSKGKKILNRCYNIPSESVTSIIDIIK